MSISGTNVSLSPKSNLSKSYSVLRQANGESREKLMVQTHQNADPVDSLNKQ
jgi:hypothetical protein